MNDFHACVASKYASINGSNDFLVSFFPRLSRVGDVDNEKGSNEMFAKRLAALLAFSGIVDI